MRPEPDVRGELSIHLTKPPFMGHSVTGFIASSETAALALVAEPRLRGFSLEQAAVLFPLSNDLIDEIFPPSRDRGPAEFTYLSPPVMEFLLALSVHGPIAYFETEYHGGTGDQVVVVFRGGQVAYGPRRGEIGPINEALRLLGIERLTQSDEFQAVGLWRHRFTEEWLELDAGK